jgi:hypothetical protein
MRADSFADIPTACFSEIKRKKPSEVDSTENEGEYYIPAYSYQSFMNNMD